MTWRGLEFVVKCKKPSILSTAIHFWNNDRQTVSITRTAYTFHEKGHPRVAFLLGALNVMLFRAFRTHFLAGLSIPSFDDATTLVVMV